MFILLIFPEVYIIYTILNCKDNKYVFSFSFKKICINKYKNIQLNLIIKLRKNNKLKHYIYSSKKIDNTVNNI